jgi:DNA primase
VIFPIINHKGQVVGFGARVLDETLPKYVNSPETPVYTKGSHLYGLNLAIEHIKQKDFVIIVEGYLDFLTPYQAGITNIVASLGTALTIEQVRLLKRFTKNIVMVFDSDSAGQAASLRGLDIAVTEDINVKVATLPQGYDPDKFVKEKGAENFQKVIGQARDFFDYKYDLLKVGFPDSDVRSKARIAGEMLLTIARLPNAVARAEYMKRLANRLDVEPQALWEEIKKVRVDRPQTTGPDAKPSLSFSKPASCINVAEKMLLGLALEEPRLIAEIRSHLTANGINKENDFKMLLDAVCDYWEKNKTINIAKLTNYVKKEEYCKTLVDACSAVEDVTDKDKCLKDCIRSIKQSHIKMRMKDLQGQIKTAQEQNYDEEYLSRLINEYNSLLKQKIEV